MRRSSARRTRRPPTTTPPRLARSWPRRHRGRRRGCCARGSCGRRRATRRSSCRRSSEAGSPASASRRPASTAWRPRGSRSRRPVTLPVYYSWSFQTGEAGDFASLVAAAAAGRRHPGRRLAARPGGQPARRGPGQPGRWSTWPARCKPVGSHASPAWPGCIDAARLHGGARRAHQRQRDRSSTPPLYGRWLAAASALSTAAERHAAVVPPAQRRPACPGRRRARHGCSSSPSSSSSSPAPGPRSRASAPRTSGCGSPSWPASSRSALYTRHLTALDPQSLIQVSSPLHGRVRVGAATVGGPVRREPDRPRRARARVAPGGPPARHARCPPGPASAPPSTGARVRWPA